MLRRASSTLLATQQPLRATGLRAIHASPTVAKCNGHHDEPNSILAEKIDEYISKEDENMMNEYPELMGSHPELADVLAANKAWVDRMNKEDPEFFKRVGGKQKPRYLYIGCSDARVDPSRLMGLDYGKLFVHRNVGNQVSSSDLNVLTVVDFAVNHLHVPHIVVCGHYDCGAVRGSIARPEDGGLGLVENWLRSIRDVARLHREELQEIDDGEARQRRLVELNVVEQCLNLYKLGPVQRRRVKTYTENHFSFALPRIHGLVFDPANGILKKLPLDFKKEVEIYRELYDLYRLPDWITRRESYKEATIPEQAGFWDGKKRDV
ncbi:Carbonic anhydrase [Hondaea fermentalgiana]|uniref:Carbonic anhydrase n=1 Tax=Hondaea fermentalgiana TaxID=2315210 RepID=A0A2R5G875_9STRA|nr:Carbonic anhydrase [Hondaea fermentalgiana]|eukprot:GBG25988.1 Carbonic anhydrase [Hondaea fermentalgiana]